MRKTLPLILLLLAASFAAAQATQTWVLRSASGALSVAEATTAVEVKGSAAGVLLKITTITTPDGDDEIDFYIQTSYDGGTTYHDMENVHLATANNGQTKTKILRFGERTFTSTETALDLTDGALTDNTKVRAPLGSHLRVKTVLTGATAPTYAYSATVVFN